MTLSDQSAYKLLKLNEFDIQLERIVELAFNCYNTNSTDAKISNSNLIWQFEPDTSINEAGILVDQVSVRDTRHEKFVSNSDVLGTYLAEIIYELSKGYSLSFEMLSQLTDNIDVVKVDQGATWITY